MKSYKFISAFILSVILVACGMNANSGKGKNFNLFTIQQDREFGAQVAAEIDANKTEYPQLDSLRNKDVYSYLYKVRDKILNTGKVKHKADFQWRLRVIKNDSIMNAFCTPGGYIYIYTGILKFLDNEAEFAGVLAHEIAHADMRHSTRQMTKIYGIQVLLQIIAGDRKMIKEVTAGIINLKFSREHETEADYNSVMYLCPTDYNAAGGAGFFRKIQAMGGAKVPEFLSTHPNPSNRIEHFENTKTTLGCSGVKDFVSEYKAMVNKLPK